MVESMVGWISAARTRWHGPGGKGLVVRGFFVVRVTLVVVLISVITDEPDIYAYQEGENEGLNEADQNFQEVKRNRQTPPTDTRHGMHQIFSTEHVAEKP